jgi:hypothetical protein
MLEDLDKNENGQQLKINEENEQVRIEGSSAMMSVGKVEKKKKRKAKLRE